MKRAPMNPNRGPDHSRGKGVFGGYAPAPPMRRLRKVKVTEVRCPSCGAEPDETCTANGGSGSGRKIGEPCGPHSTRQRMAVRVDNERREAEGTLKPVAPAYGRKTGVRELPADSEVEQCSYCGLKIQVDEDGKRLSHTSKGGAYSRRFIGRCPGSGESTDHPGVKYSSPNHPAPL